MLVGLSCAACSVILGIDGDIIDTGPPQISVAPSSLVLAQSGTVALIVSRGGTVARADRLARVVVEGLPKGVTVSGPTDLLEGQTITLQLSAAANVILGASKPAVVAEDVGKTTLPFDLQVTGHLDTSFGDQGFARVPFRGKGEEFGFALDTNDRPYVAFEHAVGSAAAVPSVARCNTNGLLDPTFGREGFEDTALPGESFSTAVFANGDIPLLFGYAAPGEASSAPFSFKPGKPAVLFAELGPDLGGLVAAVARAKDGYIGIGARVDGDENADAFVFRAAADGSQSAFGGGPYLAETKLIGRAIAVDSDDTFVIAGESTDGREETVVSRHLADGSVDSSFGTSGFVTASEGKPNLPYAMTFDGAGRLVVVSVVQVDADMNPNLRVARMSKSGIQDATFGTGGKVVLPPPASAKLPGFSGRAVLARDGKLLIGGAFESSSAGTVVKQTLTVVALTEAGTIDPSFGTDGFFTVPIPPQPGSSQTLGIVGHLARQRDGSLLIAASVTQGGTNDIVMVRYKP